MSKNDFLKNLKESLEKGEFNSEAAQRINDIDKLADRKIGGSGGDVNKLQEEVESKLEGNKKVVDEEEVKQKNADYEKKIEELKRKDFINSKHAALINQYEATIEMMGNLKEFIVEVEEILVEDNDDDIKETIKQIKEVFNF